MFLRRKIIERVSDEDLVARVRSGQRDALAVLWDRYAQLLYGTGMKYLRDVERAKDLVVDLFADLPDLLGRHDVKTFRPWVHTVMRNRSLMVLRRRERSAPLEEPLLVSDEEEDDTILREATLQRLEMALDGLKDAQRDCIRYFYLDRDSYKRTAERTGLSVEQVRSHIQNGRRNLRLILERHAHRNDR